MGVKNPDQHYAKLAKSSGKKSRPKATGLFNVNKTAKVPHAEVLRYAIVPSKPTRI